MTAPSSSIASDQQLPVENSSITSASPSAVVSLAPLPLGWTQISRNSDKKKADSPCCEDPSCRRRAPSTATRALSTTTPTAASGTVALKGHAIFLWCEIDPKWFQGYFVVPHSGTGTPMGLLAQQTDIDECLACADGGYREISLQLFQTSGSKVTHTISDIAWTGGDMMTLQGAGDTLLFQTERLLTGKKAVPLVEQHFAGLIRKLQDEDEDVPVLDLLPDVAVLVGNMRLSLPNQQQQDGDDDF